MLNELLPELGPEKSMPFIPTLVKLLDDVHAENGKRTHAAMVLGRIKPVGDASIWHALEAARKDNDYWLKAMATWAWCELGRFEELGLVKVPAGDFLMGSTEEDQSARDVEKPRHTVYLSDYYIGKCPITVVEYRSFIPERVKGIPSLPE